MGFLKAKEPAPTPVPTASPAPAVVDTQKTVQEQQADETVKKKKQAKAGKSSLTVALDTTSSGVNTGTAEKQSGLAVGGV